MNKIKSKSKKKTKSSMSDSISGSKYYKWRCSLSIKHPTFLIVGDLIFLITLFATMLTIKDSYINWHQRQYESDQAALEYYRIGEKYYSDKNYKDALSNFEKVYDINKSLFDTKYYYTMSMLGVNQSKNSILARKVLYENSEYLNDNEKALYAMLECNQGNYFNSSNILAEIKEPFSLRSDIFNQYIVTSSITNFNLSFKEGQNKVFDNKLLIDRKINSLGLLSDIDIKKFDDVTVNLDIQTLFRDESYKLKESAMEMFIFYLNECMEKEEYGRILPVMEMASSYFEIFSTKENVAKDYLNHFYDYMNMFSGYNQVHLKSIDIITKNVICKLENGNKDIWTNDLIRCKQIYNKIIDDYNTDWTPYN
ncbi:hypothetical protein Desde_1706 [Desulfitobacterium dehalogenans ATCC 51507]|uniref:Uncharacterized protein n=1 Tax=Desulfitobacterium dehalogenans (strain ATCC 51507 / DSM 9161 / JW/IU-DC1) TaxID=756499 RepID=I4A822_DESDJ|nr:hypothetical protein [Desulfitobacterium dehalogenans]AFM00107.1 hypothetical protein Desde_1706 [Desulfitobacterium dehalogenans ATCC 51507]